MPREKKNNWEEALRQAEEARRMMLDRARRGEIRQPDTRRPEERYVEDVQRLANRAFEDFVFGPPMPVEAPRQFFTQKIRLDWGNPAAEIIMEPPVPKKKNTTKYHYVGRDAAFRGMVLEIIAESPFGTGCDCRILSGKYKGDLLHLQKTELRPIKPLNV